jgi:hypothetical protein
MMMMISAIIIIVILSVVLESDAKQEFDHSATSKPQEYFPVWE